MSHKMNPISGYYEGPPGVFYDFTHDEIFELIWNGGEVYRRNVGIVGRLFQFNQTMTDYHRKSDNTSMTGMDNCILLGDL